MPLPPEASALLQSLKKVAIKAAKVAGAAILDQSLADAEEVIVAAEGLAEHYRGEIRAARGRVQRPTPPVDPAPDVRVIRNCAIDCDSCPSKKGQFHHKNCPARYS